EVGVLPEPAQPRATREIALEYRASIDVRLSVHCMTDLILDPATQLVQPVDHHVVVIIATRVARYGTGRLRAAVIHRDDDGALHAFEWSPRVASLLGASLQI